MRKHQRAEYPSGELLWGFLATQWEAAGQAPSQWGLQHGVGPGQITRWAQGQEPRLHALVDLANELDIDLVGLLVTVGVLRPDQATGRQPAPTPPPAVLGVDEALARDPSFTAPQRKFLRETIALIRGESALTPPATSGRGPMKMIRRK